MYFIKNGLGKKWAWLGVLFSIFGILACMGTGAMVQANSISLSIAKTFSVPVWIVAVILLILAGAVLIGGVKRIGFVAGRLVPFMAVIYVAVSLIVIALHIHRVPEVFWWVVSDAFTPTAASGGFVGATFMMAVRMGMARGIFSNEAGLAPRPWPMPRPPLIRPWYRPPSACWTCSLIRSLSAA